MGYVGEPPVSTVDSSVVWTAASKAVERGGRSADGWALEMVGWMGRRTALPRVASMVVD